jgi:hypothetical protein
MPCKSRRNRRKRKREQQLLFSFLDYERSPVVRHFLCELRHTRAISCRRQRALFALPFLDERIVEFADTIDRAEPLIPAVALRFGVSRSTIRYLRTFTAAELRRVGWSLEDIAAAAEAARPGKADPKLLDEAVWKIRFAAQLSEAVGISRAELVRRAGALERLPSSHFGGDLAAPLRTLYQQVFLPEVLLLARASGRAASEVQLDALLKQAPREIWARLGGSFFGCKGPSAILEMIASWHNGGGQPLSTPGGRPALDALRAIPSWQPLLPALVVTGDVVVTSITTVRALIEEGLRLRHCIGRYAMGCAYGGRHVLGLRTKLGFALSTAMFQLSPEGGLRLIEHRGFANCQPDPRAAQALGHAIHQMKRSIDPEWLRALEMARLRRIGAAGGEDAATRRLYPFYAPSLREYMFRAYVAPYLPREFREISRDEWLERTRLRAAAAWWFDHLRESFGTAPPERRDPVDPGLLSRFARSFDRLAMGRRA